MTIVFTNGCFDIIHRGHLQLLHYAKTLDDDVYLIVGLNSDASVKRLKGDSRPVNNQDDRKYVLESIRFVNEVIIFEDDDPYRLIEQIRPDVLVKGGDYEYNDIVGRDLVSDVRIYPTITGYSTTKIIKDIGDR